MSDYAQLIESTKVFSELRATPTTGDVEYDGTAVEVSSSDGTELFHVVVDRSGQKQVLVLATEDHYRIPLDVLEDVLARARPETRKIER